MCIHKHICIVLYAYGIKYASTQWKHMANHMENFVHYAIDLPCVRCVFCVCASYATACARNIGGRDSLILRHAILKLMSSLVNVMLIN